jgi:hypothetical protein
MLDFSNAFSQTFKLRCRNYTTMSLKVNTYLQKYNKSL